MLYLESMSEVERKNWVDSVLLRLKQLHNIKYSNSLDEIYNFPAGTTNTISSKGNVKRVIDMALTASDHFKVSLDFLLKAMETNKTTMPQAELEVALFKAFELGLIKVEYQNINLVAKLICDEIQPKISEPEYLLNAG